MLLLKTRNLRKTFLLFYRTTDLGIIVSNLEQTIQREDPKKIQVGSIVNAV